jgi:hypothetical protein
VQRLAKRLEKSKREMNIPTTTDHIAAARLCFQAADELCSDLSDQLAIQAGQVQATIGVGQAILALVRCFHDDAPHLASSLGR